MQRFIDDGYAVKVNEETACPRVWYLPHFGVQNVNKPGRVRLVFDAAAKTKGVSLNDQLDPDPDLLGSLPGVLMRFRQHAVAIKADIKDMFLRVKIREQDRGVQCFLWRGSDRKMPPKVFEMTCLIFGAKSSPSSAIHIKNTNTLRFSMVAPNAVITIIRNCYMDDYLASQATVEEAKNLVSKVSLINSEGNFFMHGWASNESCAVKHVADDKKLQDINPAQIGNRDERVLGLYWDRKSDKLAFNVGLRKIPVKLLDGTTRPTKRELLRIIMSVFDPLGILAPFTLRAKILMQDVWRSGIGWDTKIKEEQHQGWLSWLKCLNKIGQCKIPRCYIPAKNQYIKTQMHVFCEASLKAFAVVAYLRTEAQNGEIHISLITAKTRVSPVKPLTVPRLELQAALLGTRIAKSVEEEIEIKLDQRFFWSDSTTVLQWIRSEPRTRQMYVANRLGKIG